jgi:hypothetical protein
MILPFDEIEIQLGLKTQWKRVDDFLKYHAKVVADKIARRDNKCSQNQTQAAYVVLPFSLLGIRSHAKAA